MLTTDTEAERYRKMFLDKVKENDNLKEQIAEEVRQKYAAYKRIEQLLKEREQNEKHS